jgi:16S rRNA processing protein RimM
MEQYFQIGKLVAHFGLKGELVLQHSLGELESTGELKVIFIQETPGSFLPYFIRSVRPKRAGELLISVEGVDTPEQARKLTPRAVWLRAEAFQKLAAASSPLSVLGYRLISGSEDLGEIIEVIEQPHQLLFSILLGEKEAYIPIHEKTLRQIDSVHKKVYVDLPEGLLDIYR